MTKTMTDFDFVDGIKKQDRGVLTHLYKEWGSTIAQIATGNNGSPSDAEDLVQDTFVALWSKINEDKFRGDSSLKTYTMGIARNLWLDRLRKRSKLSSVPADDVLQTREDTALGDLDSKLERDMVLCHLETALLDLSAECQQRLNLCYKEGLDHREIASVIGRSVGSIRVLLFRCRQSLLEILKERFALEL